MHSGTSLSKAKLLTDSGSCLRSACKGQKKLGQCRFVIVRQRAKKAKVQLSSALI